MNLIAWVLEGRAQSDLRGPLRILAFCLVFFGIPLGLVFIAHKELQNFQRQDQIAFRKAELENRIGIFSQWVPHLESFDRTLLTEWKRCCRSDNPRRAMAAWRARLKKWFPRAIEMEFLDRSGKRIESLSDHVLSDKLLSALHADSSRPTLFQIIAAMRRNMDYFRRELGPLLGRLSGKVINRMENLNIHARWIATLISDPYDEVQMILLFRESRSWAEMISSYRLQSLRESQRDMAVAAVDLRLPLARQVRSLGSAGQRVADLLHDPVANSGGAVVQGPWIMAQVPIQQHLRAVFALPWETPEFKQREDWRRVPVPAMLCGIFLVLSCCGWRWFLSPSHPYLSLRWKIGLLLLFVVGLPLGLLGLAAQNSLREYRSLLEQRLWNRQEQALQEIENEYRFFQGMVEASIHHELKRVATQPENLIPDLLRRIDGLFNKFTPQLCEVVNEKGKPLTTSYLNDKSSLKQFLGLLQTFSGRVLADLNLGRGRSMTMKEQFVTATGEMLGMNMDLMYAAITRFLGELTPFRIGPDQFMIFMQPVFDRAQTARQIAIMGWNASSLPLDYVRQLGLPIRDLSGEIEIWMPFGQRTFQMPSNMPFQDEIVRLLPRMRTESQSVRWKLSQASKISFDTPTEEMELGEVKRITPTTTATKERQKKNRRSHSKVLEKGDLGNTPEDIGFWLATSSIRLNTDGTVFCVAGKGEALKSYSLIAYSTDERIQAELGKARSVFLVVALIFLSMVLAASRLLAARFLIPVNDLAEGVRALRERRFSHRIPIRNDDELGQLSMTFNGMAEGLKDLEVARLVQENYFPSLPLERDGWTVSGSCQPASRVGGDYLDFFPIGEKRLGLVIGDVSGHGVGAALVVGMAKALIASPTMILEPAAILERMQRVFAATLKRKKMMTCCVVMFEPETGRLWSANAGHNLPYLVRGNGLVEQLKPGGKPLGTKNKPFAVQEECLANDDWLFMYTDGFIEAARLGDVSGECIGYERVEEALPGLRREDAQTTENALREWFVTQAAPGPQADDITILVLRKDVRAQDRSK
ncbi:MAG: SpoIIE family protein phosphatase [Candidatus Ozemobacteraceae bacterium]